MEKQALPSAPPADNFQSAPPSYEEAVNIQPPFNPHMHYEIPVQQPPMPQVPVVPVQVAAHRVPTVPLAVGPVSATLECPHCHKRVRTVTRTESQKSAHVAALVLCLCGCWCCCCIPYCLSAFQDVHHKCPECNGFIGTYKR